VVPLYGFDYADDRYDAKRCSTPTQAELPRSLLVDIVVE
jgi:hypothetical protein